MHKDVLHILNNNHIFGITDKRGGGLFTMNIHIKTFGNTIHPYHEGDWPWHRKRNTLSYYLIQSTQ